MIPGTAVMTILPWRLSVLPLKARKRGQLHQGGPVQRGREDAHDVVMADPSSTRHKAPSVSPSARIHAEPSPRTRGDTPFAPE